MARGEWSSGVLKEAGEIRREMSEGVATISNSGRICHKIRSLPRLRKFRFNDLDRLAMILKKGCSQPNALQSVGLL